MADGHPSLRFFEVFPSYYCQVKQTVSKSKRIQENQNSKAGKMPKTHQKKSCCFFQWGFLSVIYEMSLKATEEGFPSSIPTLWSAVWRRTDASIYLWATADSNLLCHISLHTKKLNKNNKKQVSFLFIWNLHNLWSSWKISPLDKEHQVMHDNRWKWQLL